MDNLYLFNSNEYKQWMTDNIKIRINIPVNRIHIPVTHDSLSYTTDYNCSIGDKTTRSIIKLAKHLPCLQRDINDWVNTQKMSIYDQLCLGVRGLDLRVCYFDKFIGSHTFPCEKLSIVFLHIRQFLVINKSEILIINIKPDYIYRKTMTYKINNKLMKMILDEFGDMLTPVTETFPTYGEMLKNGHQIILYYQSDNVDKFKFNWPSKNHFYPWHSTIDINTMKKDLDQDFNVVREEKNMLNTINLNLSPPDNIIQKNIIYSLLFPRCIYQPVSIKSISNGMHKIIPRVLDKHKDKIKYISGFAVNYPTDNLIKLIIDLNSK